MTLDFLPGSDCEVAEIKHPDASTTLKSCPQCLLFNPNYRSMVIPPSTYTPIANAVAVAAAIEAVPPSNILTTVQRPITSFMSHTSKGREEARRAVMEAKKAGRADLWDKAIPGAMGSFGKVKKAQKTMGSQARVDAFNEPKKNKSKFSFNPCFLEYILTLSRVPSRHGRR